jgi:hypothetical protein
MNSLEMRFIDAVVPRAGGGYTGGVDGIVDTGVPFAVQADRFVQYGGIFSFKPLYRYHKGEVEKAALFWTEVLTTQNIVECRTFLAATLPLTNASTPIRGRVTEWLRGREMTLALQQQLVGPYPLGEVTHLALDTIFAQGIKNEEQKRAILQASKPLLPLAERVRMPVVCLIACLGVGVAIALALHGRFWMPRVWRALPLPAALGAGALCGAGMFVCVHPQLKDEQADIARARDVWNRLIDRAAEARARLAW